jgi:hypothetical protein
MRFLEVLIDSHVSPQKLIALQNEFVLLYKTSRASKKISLKDYLDRDQQFTQLEKFINRIEWELLQEKMQRDAPGGVQDKQRLDFVGLLGIHGINPDNFIMLQHEFIIHTHTFIEHVKEKNYREYLELDQFLTFFEKFLSKVERERFQQKTSFFKFI